MKPTEPQDVLGQAPRTDAAIAARRKDSQAALDRVRAAITTLHREGAPATVAVVARRAGVSRTFVYTNPDARAAIDGAKREHPTGRDRQGTANGPQCEASWRERALNAEDAHKQAITEIRTQREHIGQLLGHIRDLESEWDKEAIGRITTENTTLKDRAHQLAVEVDTLGEKLAAARSNLRFQDRRIADLEAQLADPQAAT